jgi:cell wall-associated NlpC family hydrolase
MTHAPIITATVVRRAIACLAIVVASSAFGQVASPPAPKHHAAVQQAPGEGDPGESAEIDEATDAKPHAGPYRSPYKLAFKAPLHDLLFDAVQPRGGKAEQSSVPVHEWYSPQVRHEWGSWGVPARVFDCPPQVMQKPAEWRRERVVAAAGRFIGYQYQHHHVPDWNPPAGWPWQECCAGHNGPGVDCSNFSGWNYNWALGIHLNTDVHKQAAARSTRSSHGELHAQVVERPEGHPREWYDKLVGELRAGDLLYIGNKSRTKVTHVIMWVGECGTSPDGGPLVIDSTGGRIKDANGHAIPCGIHLRPFKQGSWYHESFSHAHRWVR